jgi:hypothetical protein
MKEPMMQRIAVAIGRIIVEYLNLAKSKRDFNNQ